MNIMCVNIRGLGGKDKTLALKLILEVDKLDILLLQETMWKWDPLVVDLKNFFLLGLHCFGF